MRPKQHVDEIKEFLGNADPEYPNRLALAYIVQLESALLRVMGAGTLKEPIRFAAIGYSDDPSTHDPATSFDRPKGCTCSAGLLELCYVCRQVKPAR